MIREHAAPLAAANPLFDTEFLLAVGALVLVLLGGAVAFYFAEQWKRKQLANGYQDLDSLTHYRAMLTRGELSPEEYERVRDQLAARIKNTVGVGTPGAATHPLSQADRSDETGSDSDNDSPKALDQEPPRT